MSYREAGEVAQEPTPKRKLPDWVLGAAFFLFVVAFAVGFGFLATSDKPKAQEPAPTPPTCNCQCRCVVEAPCEPVETRPDW